MMRQGSIFFVLVFGAVLFQVVFGPNTFGQCLVNQPAYQVSNPYVPGNEAGAAGSIIMRETNQGQIGMAWLEADVNQDWSTLFVLLDTFGQPVSQPVKVDTQKEGRAPTLAYDGQHFAVVWSDMRNWPSSSLIYFRQIEGDGSILAPEVLVYESSLGCSSPSVTWTGSRYALVWSEWTDPTATNGIIKFTFLDKNGSNLGPNQAISEADAFSDWTPVVASNQTTSIAVVWVARRNGGAEGGAHLMVFDLDGSIVTPETQVSDETETYPPFYWFEDHYTLFQMSRLSPSTIRIQEFDELGNELALYTFEETGYGNSDIRTWKDYYLLVWGDKENQEGEPELSIFSPLTFNHTPAMAWVNQAGFQGWPALALESGSIVVAWQSKVPPDHTQSGIYTTSLVCDILELIRYENKQMETVAQSWFIDQFPFGLAHAQSGYYRATFEKTILLLKDGQGILVSEL